MEQPMQSFSSEELLAVWEAGWRRSIPLTAR